MRYKKKRTRRRHVLRKLMKQWQSISLLLEGLWGFTVRQFFNLIRLPHFREELKPFVIIGFLILTGLGLALVLLPGMDGKIGANRGAMTSLRLVFGKNIPVPGLQSDGGALLGSFETPREFQAWKILNAKASESSEIHAEGQLSLKVEIPPDSKFTLISLEDLMLERHSLGNWSHFGSLSFFIANLNAFNFRMRVRVTDIWGNSFERDVNIQKGGGQVLTFPIERIAAEIDIRHADQITFFTQSRKNIFSFYLDNIRLNTKAKGSGEIAGDPTPGHPARDMPKKNRPARRLYYGFDQLKKMWMFAHPQHGPVVRIPFVVKNETSGFCKLCPVEGSIPFAMGEVHDPAQLRLFTGQDDPVDFETQVLARWPDQSFKWLKLIFLTPIPPQNGLGFFLDYRKDINSETPAALMDVTEDPDRIRVNTGTALFVLNKKEFYLFESVFIDADANGSYSADEKVVEHAEMNLQFEGKTHQTHADKKAKFEIEHHGPLRTVIKATGWYQSREGHRFSKALVRYSFYRGLSSVALAHTLIYTGYPENPYLNPLRKKHLPKNEVIESYSMVLPFAVRDIPASLKLQIGKIDHQALEYSAFNKLDLIQTAWNRAQVISTDTPLDISNAQGWVDLTGSRFGITVAVRKFKENFPKAFRADGMQNTLQLDLWPQEAGGLDLKTTDLAFGNDALARGSAFGLGKTHDLFLHFHSASAPHEDIAPRAHAFEERLLIRNNPFWVEATGVLGRLYPVERRYGAQEKILEDLFDWADRMPRMFQWYGMLNFGDTLSWFRNQDEENQYTEWGWHPKGRWGWYNCEGAGTHTGALIQFIRSGEWKYFSFGENLARHIMDIDTVHFNTVAEDSRLHKMLDDHFSMVGSMHRHNGNHWGGRNEEYSHTNVAGLLLYYYISGDARAWDVLQEVGSFYLAERFTYTGHPDLAPNRSLGNALWGASLLYDATGDTRYKHLADKLIEIFLAGQESNGSFMETYDPVRNYWKGAPSDMYMAWYLVNAFMAYFDITQDEDVRVMLLKLVDYLSSREFAAPTILHAMAYAYWVSGGDARYLGLIEKNLEHLSINAKSSSDPMYQGLIYDKPIYHRPMTFLHTVPYAFAALEDGFRRKQQ